MSGNKIKRVIDKIMKNEMLKKIMEKILLSIIDVVTDEYIKKKSQDTDKALQNEGAFFIVKNIYILITTKVIKKQFIIYLR